MASKGCSSCLRALQRPLQTLPRAPAFPTRRSFASKAPAAASARGQEPAGSPSVKSNPGASKPRQEAPVVLPGSLATIMKHAGTYTAYGVTEGMFKQCSAQADYKIPQAADEDFEMPKTADGEDLGMGGGWWHKDAGLNPTFSTWSQVTMLHMYILSARFRCFAPAESQLWQQHLLDHFFYDAENRMMTSHNMHARSTRNKYLKDLFIQWRGLLFAYDEGLVKGDPVLASAVWRNVFKGGERVDVKALASIVGYMRKSLMELDKIGDEEFKTGAWAFGSPKGQMVELAKRSRMMDAPFKEKIEEK